MEEIARKVGIAKGSVFNVIELKESVGYRLRLFHAIAVRLRKSGLDIDDFSELIRAGNLFQEYGIHKRAVWPTLVEIVTACYKLRLKPIDLVSFLQSFERFAAHYKTKTPKQVMEHIKTIISCNQFLLGVRVSEKEELARLRRARATEEQKLRNLYPDMVKNLDQLGVALVEERIKSKKLQKRLNLREITSPETVFTHPDSLARLNRKYGLSYTSDAVFRKVMHLLKYPHKYPGFFIENEREQSHSIYDLGRGVTNHLHMTRIRRRRRRRIDTI